MEITNISHFSGFGKSEKAIQFGRIREKIELNIEQFDAITEYENIILKFLIFERDKLTIKAQADSLRILAAKIFNNLNTMVSL